MNAGVFSSRTQAICRVRGRSTSDLSLWNEASVDRPVGDRLAFPRFGGAEDGVADFGGAVAVCEGGAVGVDVVVPGDGVEEGADFVDEGVFPAEHVSLRPPPVPEGVLGLGDEDGAEALVAVAVLELVEALKVEGE